MDNYDKQTQEDKLSSFTPMTTTVSPPFAPSAPVFDNVELNQGQYQPPPPFFTYNQTAEAPHQVQQPWTIPVPAMPANNDLPAAPPPVYSEAVYGNFATQHQLPPQINNANFNGKTGEVVIVSTDLAAGGEGRVAGAAPSTPAPVSRLPMSEVINMMMHPDKLRKEYFEERFGKFKVVECVACFLSLVICSTIPVASQQFYVGINAVSMAFSGLIIWLHLVGVIEKLDTLKNARRIIVLHGALTTMLLLAASFLTSKLQCVGDGLCATLPAAVVFTHISWVVYLVDTGFQLKRYKQRSQ